MKTLLICTLGGVAVGYVTGYWIGSRVMCDGDHISWSEPSKFAITHVADGLNNETITTFSQLSLLLGTPTPSDNWKEDGHIEFRLYEDLDNFPDLRCNRSVMARYLTEEMYEVLSRRKTCFGFTVDMVIQTGIDSPDKMGCGIVAGDEHCYDVFEEIFEPVVSERHETFDSSWTHIKNMSGYGLPGSQFDPEYVLSVHFLIGRCMKGFRFLPSCSRAERKHVEMLLKEAFLSLPEEYRGRYISLCDLTADIHAELPDLLQSIVDRPASATLLNSGVNRDWPDGRGVFYSDDATFFAWTNREDHLRVMYRDRNIDFIGSYVRFANAIHEVEKNLRGQSLEFAFHSKYGYLLTCPSGIGTALRAGVHMKIPHLLKDDRLRKILKRLRLHITCYEGIAGQDVSGGYVDIYNSDRLGYTEDELVQRVADGVVVLVEMEKRMERNQSINDLIPEENQSDNTETDCQLE